MKVTEEGHIYRVRHMDSAEEQELMFINRLNGAQVHDGTTNEEVLEVLIDRMRYLQKRMPCRENAIVLTKLEECLMWLQRRKALRVDQGVLSQDTPHEEPVSQKP